MIISKMNFVKSLIESRDGVHLTLYLENPGELDVLHSQLRRSIEYAYENIAPVMSAPLMKRLLGPLDKLAAEPNKLMQMKGNVGIFRNLEMFRILNVPVHVSTGCHVASSFHVKPLIKWLQSDQEFLLLSLDRVSEGQIEVSIHAGDHASFRQSAMSLLQAEVSPHAAVFDFSWVHDVLQAHIEYGTAKVFLLGEVDVCDALKKEIDILNLDERFVGTGLGQRNLEDVCREIRVSMMLHARRRLESTLNEFVIADLENRTSKNLFQIAKAVVKGRVRKLIVSDEIQIFGNIDRRTGGLSIHPFDLDHEDDDLLDDLAQIVLSQGGEVYVASQDEIPKGRPILAILEDDRKTPLRLENVAHFEMPRENIG